jgi:large subunit ribosomal protein L13
MSTYVPPVKSRSAKWHVIDANGKVLGRIATNAAKILQGSIQPTTRLTSTWAITS